ncbi:MAG: L,D-transpeptidase family protein [Gammaproteobacteria bacterium]
MRLHTSVARLLAATALVLPVLAAAAGAEAELLLQRLETLQQDPDTTLSGEHIAATDFLLQFYARRGFRPAWHAPEKARELIAVIESIDEEGLSPDDYHFDVLAAGREPLRRDVDFDIILTDALVRLGAHLRFGKVDAEALDPNWNMGRTPSADDPVGALQDAIDAPSLRAYFDRQIPRQDFYQRLKQALARYRAIAAAGGWPALPGGPSLKPGMLDPRVVLVRQRLAAEGDAPAGTPAEAARFDDELAAAVKRFQQRHGLLADGIVGRRTLAAMNVPVGARVDQLRANLERSRWVFTEPTGDFIAINIAGFRLYLVQNDELAWSSEVTVGRTYRKTPVFKAAMENIVLNPTWTVPPTILRKDILPRARENPDYLREKGYVLLDQAGQRVPLNRVDWPNARPGNFPYIVRQPAGPDNALGRVKFIFPNPHLVFLHDTNHPELFARQQRTFSSGCIRLKDPLELAERLLADQPGWDRAAIDRQLASGKTRTVQLARPLPVLVLYWTAMADADGSVRFMQDVYGRDQRIIDGLGAPFSFARAARARAAR